MKRKILVPIMALAIAVTAGVNYKMVDNTNKLANVTLSEIFKTSFAIAETNAEEGTSAWQNFCENVAETIDDVVDWITDKVEDVDAWLEEHYDGCETDELGIKTFSWSW